MKLSVVIPAYNEEGIY